MGNWPVIWFKFTIFAEQIKNMNYIDWIIIILAGLGLVKGLLDGLVRQLVSLVGIILGSWIAIHYAGDASSFLHRIYDFPVFVTKALSFIIPFFLVIIVGNLLATIVKKLLSEVGLGPLDHVAGAVFGTLKSLLILSIVFNLFQMIDQNNRIVKLETKQNSIGFYPVLKVSPFVLPYLQQYFDYGKDEGQMQKKPDDI